MPVILWMVVIFTASTDLMSAEHTSRFIGPFLRWLVPEISAGAMAAAEFLVRKLAHLTEYAILGALLSRAFHGYLSMRPSKFLATVAFLAAAIFAATDEFHQSFVASRTASVHDVLIDTCGALLGLAAYWMLLPRPSLAAPNQQSEIGHQK